MTKTKGKPSSESDVFSVPRELETLRSSNGSHQMTLTRTPQIEGIGEDISYNSIEYHLTARITNESLTVRDLSLLLEVLNYQCVHFGVNFTMRLTLYEIYFRCLGNKRSSREVKNNKIRLTLTVSEILLHSLRGVEHSLDTREFVELSPTVKSILGKHIMSSRTYGSRYRTWRPEKFVVVKAVPVDIQFLNSRKRPNRYSSYCKGYGESHPSNHSKKTMPSAELDGNGTWFGQDEEMNLFIRCTDPIHVLCEFLLIKYNNETGEKL